MKAYRHDGDGVLDGGDTLLTACAYDGLNRRARKVAQSPSATYHYFYNASRQVLEVPNTGNSHPYEQYAWSVRYNDGPIVRWDANDDGDADDDCTDGSDERLYYLTDANMNVTGLVEADGDPAERYAYEPYGKVTIYDGTWSSTRAWEDSRQNEILFCGYVYSGRTGLYQVRHRVYHPTLGRWAQRDPIPYQDGMNLYLAVRASPTNLTDPTGLADSVSNSFLHAILSGNWREAWMIIEVTAGVKIYAHTDISSLKNEAIGYFRRTVAAVASRGSLKMDVALTNVNKAWKIVRPEHLWCRLTNLLPGTQDVAVQNFRRVQPFIEQAWAKGKLVNMDNQGSVLKEHMIGDALVRVIGWFERTAEGTIRISDAWVQR